MNKKIKHSLLAIIFAGLLVSCNNADSKSDQNVASENRIEDNDQSKQKPNREDNNENDKEEENSNDKEQKELKTENEEDSKETESTDEETVEEPTEDDNLITDDGTYYTFYNPTSAGEINEYGIPTIESWKIEADILTVKGSLQHPYPDGEYTENKIHTFKLTDQTTYTGVGGDGEFEMSKEDVLTAPAPSNTITVKDGLVENIRFSS